MTEATVTLTGKLEPRSGWEARGCPLAKTLDVVGSRSAFLLLREAFYGTKRFDDFAHRVGISEPVAAARLKDLVHVGLLEKRPYKEPGQRTRFEYHLTDMGVDFFPSLVALMQWGDRWLGPAGIQMQHRACGASVHAELRCAQGHALTVGEIDVVARPRGPI